MDSIRTVEVPRGPRCDSSRTRHRRHRPTTACPPRRGIGAGTQSSGRKVTIQESGPPRCRRLSVGLSILSEGQEDGCSGDREKPAPRPRTPTHFLQATIRGNPACKDLCRKTISRVASPTLYRYRRPSLLPKAIRDPSGDHRGALGRKALSISPTISPCAVRNSRHTFP